MLGHLQLIQIKATGKKSLLLQQVSQYMKRIFPTPVGRLFSEEVALKTRGKPSRIGIWNVRTLYKAGNLDKGIQQMKNMKLYIMGISLTRWTESGKITTGNRTMI